MSVNYAGMNLLSCIYIRLPANSFLKFKLNNLELTVPSRLILYRLI